MGVRLSTTHSSSECYTQTSLMGVRPLTWEYCSPSFPSGFPPPLRHSTCSPLRRRKLRRSSVARLLLFPFRIYIRRGPLGEFSPPKMRDMLFILLIEFESRIEIIERRTVLTERRSLCPTENTFGGDPDGARRATRRALRPCLLNASSSLRGRTSLPHRKCFRRGPRIAATCKRRLCRRITTRASPSSPAS